MDIMIGSHLCRSYSVCRPSTISDLIIKRMEHEISGASCRSLRVEGGMKIKMNDFESLPDLHDELEKAKEAEWLTGL